MSEITGAMIKDLREKTSAGMLDCKKALEETGGDMDAACDWLRQKGIVKAAKKSDRVAASGLVSAVACDNFACVVEVNAETDFVAKNEKFQDLVAMIAEKALADKGNFESVNSGVKDEITNAIATIGENMALRRIAAVGGDAVFTYVHNAIRAGMGQIGVAVAINGDVAKFAEIGPKIAMHIAATKPEFMTVADVDPAAVAREKKIFIESGATAGKPDQIAEKMISGRIQKYYAESVLEEQPFVMDPAKSVKAVIAEHGGTLSAFACYTLGDGIEKRADNLADEVSKLLG
ncbi:MAG: translation elongation factor Ts [Rickettsiales bacterium]|jgi:elongation factor Ts|nr:translation elongation factor Ts [Rickettsiales bacterium]